MSYIAMAWKYILKFMLSEEIPDSKCVRFSHEEEIRFGKKAKKEIGGIG